jgi:hypothetical protein
VLARPGDGQQVEQLEVVEAEHLDEDAGRAFAPPSEPAVELLLRLRTVAFDAVDAVIGSAVSFALGDEGDLVLEIGEAVVDRRGREHQHAGLHAVLDDAPHEAVVARLAVLVRRLVAEVVRLVDDHEVVVAPVDVARSMSPDLPPSRDKVGVVEHVVVEAVGARMLRRSLAL